MQKSKKIVCIYIEVELYNILAKQSNEEDLSISHLINKIIKEKLKGRN